MDDIHRPSRRLFLGGSAAAGLGLALGSPAAAMPTVIAGGGTIRNIRVTGSPVATTSHIQPTIAVNPRDPNKLFGACYSWLERWNHRNELAIYYSTDGGRSWNVGKLPGSVAFNDHNVTYGSDGVGYVWADNGLPHVWRTEDDGRTFDGPVVTSDVRIDRAIFAVDQAPARAEHLYGVWATDENETIGLTRSTDGGRTFDQTRRIAHGQGEGAEWTVTPEVTARQDTVHVTYGLWPAQVGRPGSPVEKPGRGELTGPVMVTTSHDAGATFAEPIQLGIGTIDLRVTEDTVTPSIPAVAIGTDPRVAAVAYSERNDTFADLVVCTTTDRGRSWCPPTQVTASAAGVRYYQPRLACDRAGRFVLMALRIVGTAVDVVVFTSPPGRPRFGNERVVTSQPIDPTIGPPGKNGAWWFGDVQALAVSPHAIHPIWTDGRDGHLEAFTAVVPFR